MYSFYFKALLKTENDELLETGYACVSQENNSIDFINEFVPLQKMGTILKIVHICNDEEVHHFTGKVYLSSGNLLRIVSVDENTLTQVRKLYRTNTFIPANFAPYNASFLFVGYKKACSACLSTIHSISMNYLIFATQEQLEAGQKLMFYLEVPIVLKRIIVEVCEELRFGRSSLGYRCKIISIPKSCIAPLSQYIESLESPN